ncbi:MAG: P-type conjugative transfer ATPase TrbB, partial [Pseudomonadota bacterium]
FALSPQDAERVIRLVATHRGREATTLSPIVSAELPMHGERFEGVLPPLTEAPTFSIRKPASRIYSLDDYVAQGVMSDHTACVLREGIERRLNTLVVGGTGSGKTTLVNALLAEVAKTKDRIFILEDTRELKCAAEDAVHMRTEAGVASLRDLVRSALRQHPKRIIVGEVRGGEALDMLKAWNTGHPGGIATLHANSALGGLYRLEQLIGEVTQTVPHDLIAETVHRIVFISSDERGRRVDAVSHLSGFTLDGYALEPVTAGLELVASDHHSSKPERITP